MGMNVVLQHSQFGTLELHNVTEIHLAYTDVIRRNKRIAFESDIHGTGITYDIADVIEFEAKDTEILSPSF